jgi:hypothetical protein
MEKSTSIEYFEIIDSDHDDKNKHNKKLRKSFGILDRNKDAYMMCYVKVHEYNTYCERIKNSSRKSELSTVTWYCFAIQCSSLT